MCSAGVCELAGCAEGYDNCDGDLSNGCEVEIAADPANCGLCGTMCSDNNATTACETGVCVLVECAIGALDCDTLVENGCEIDGYGDLLNCGSCGALCDADNGDVECTDGVCAIANCTNGFADCDQSIESGCETNVDTDIENCGGCRIVCEYENGTPICDGGECALAGCDAPYADCDFDAATGCEVDTSNDILNCNALWCCL